MHTLNLHLILDTELYMFFLVYSGSGLYGFHSSVGAAWGCYQPTHTHTHTHTRLRCSLLGDKHAPNLAAKNNHLIISHSFCGSGFGKGSTGRFWLSISQAVESQVGAGARAATGGGSPSPSPSLLTSHPTLSPWGPFWGLLIHKVEAQTSSTALRQKSYHLLLRSLTGHTVSLPLHSFGY